MCGYLSHKWHQTESSFRADSRFAPSQWETALLCKDVSHWLGAILESALIHQSLAATWPVAWLHKGSLMLKRLSENFIRSFVTEPWSWTWKCMVLNSLQTVCSNAFSSVTTIKCFFFLISLKFVPMDLNDNKSSLSQVMPCHQTGDKPVPEPILIQWWYIYIFYIYASLSLSVWKPLDIFIYVNPDLFTKIKDIYFYPCKGEHWVCTICYHGNWINRS